MLNGCWENSNKL